MGNDKRQRCGKSKLRQSYDYVKTVGQTWLFAVRVDWHFNNQSHRWRMCPSLENATETTSRIASGSPSSLASANKNFKTDVDLIISQCDCWRTKLQSKDTSTDCQMQQETKFKSEHTPYQSGLDVTGNTRRINRFLWTRGRVEWHHISTMHVKLQKI